MFTYVKIETYQSKGRHKLLGSPTCLQCGKPLSECAGLSALATATTDCYTVIRWKSASMAAPAFWYYHVALRPGMGGGWGDLERGRQIHTPAEVKVGDVMLEYSEQFNAYNVVRVTKIWPTHEGEPANLKGRKFNCIFVNPANTKQLRQAGDHEFNIWDFEMARTQFFLPLKAKRKRKAA